MTLEFKDNVYIGTYKGEGRTEFKGRWKEEFGVLTWYNEKDEIVYQGDWAGWFRLTNKAAEEHAAAIDKKALEKVCMDYPFGSGETMPQGQLSDVGKLIETLEAYAKELHTLLETVWYTPAGKSVSDSTYNRILIALGPTDAEEKERPHIWKLRASETTKPSHEGLEVPDGQA